MSTEMTAILDQIKELRNEQATTREAVKELGKPANLHVNQDGESFSYWEQTEEYVTPNQVGRRMKQLSNRLPREYKRSFKNAGEYLREGWFAAKGESNEWAKRYNTSIDSLKAIQGMSTQMGSDGAFLVLPEFNTQIMDRVYKNDIWNRTDQYTVSGNQMVFLANAETSRANGSRHGGLRGLWLGEGQQATPSKPTLRQNRISLNKMAVVVYLTNELLDDAGPVLEQYISRKVGEEFNFLSGDAGFNGTGVGMPLGWLNSGAMLSITKETGQASGTIVTENIDKMWARRLDGDGYAWYHNRDCCPQLDQLSQAIGTAGVALYRPSNGIAGVAPQLLKTAPRVETEFNATCGTMGDILLADFGRFITINKGGISQAVSAHVEFLTDQFALRFTMRVGGQPADVSPITPFKGSNTQSACIAVETR